MTENEAKFVELAKNSNRAYCLVHMTFTMLSKSICDATYEVREFLGSERFHDFESQPKGTENKRFLPVVFVRGDGTHKETKMSVYRPQTKKGDPRFNIYGAREVVEPDDIIMMVNDSHRVVVFNLSRTALDVVKHVQISESKVFFGAIAFDAIQTELVERLKDISSRGFIEVYREGPTGIGHLLETELGIEANSAEAPDFMGAIEIKAARNKVSRGKTLFAKVADWSISPLKSSAEILDRFGYERQNSKGREVRSLNCSVEFGRFNTQGLAFDVDGTRHLLHEVSNRDDFPVVASWGINRLTDKLTEKHKRTMWVQGSSRKDGGREQIHFLKAEYTSEPVVDQFIPMLQERMIYMDHLISRDKGKVSEQGPLFKIRPQSFGRLFPGGISFDLVFAEK
ncbi:MvaI/BcnI family restriction endonuclease [Glutamicibacter sp.]|uniref:MvaI/BcnI family restriction endonuclease n=1 Tax=Glutamicibacter sp. TaxID=1931995 RepID=UPI002B4A6642|nr:MvaI/BcnI family restriction endonuclease [Glutamicibacter sp.]HJX79396.1 MvaI/BcnI family restriction endonuclease [Glutamicibacter sp.]